MDNPYMFQTIVGNLNTALLATQAAVDMYATSDKPNATVLNRLTNLRDTAEKEYNSFLGYATAPDAA